MVIVTAYYDKDGDGLLDRYEDKDSDNDGILDANELYCNQITPPNGTWPVATTPPTTPILTNEIMFFDWSGVTLSAANPTATKSITFKGVTYTATLSNYSSTVSAPGVTPHADDRLIGYDINTWSSGYDCMIWKYYDVNGTTFKEVLRTPNDVSGTISITIHVTATYNGIEYPVDLIVFDAEGTASGSESLRYRTNAGNFQLLERTGSGTGALSTAVTGVGTQLIEYSNTEASKINALFVTSGYSPTVIATLRTSTQNSNQALGLCPTLLCFR